MDRLFPNFIYRTTHIILSQRITSLQSSSIVPSQQSTGVWFNLQVPENKKISSELDKYMKVLQKQQGDINFYIDIYLDHVQKNPQQPHLESNILLERWHFNLSQQSKPNTNNLAPSQAYQKASLVVRALYTYVLLMPTMQMFQMKLNNRPPFSTTCKSDLKFLFYTVEPGRQESCFEDGSSSKFEFETIQFSNVYKISSSVQYRSNIRAIISLLENQSKYNHTNPRIIPTTQQQQQQQQQEQPNSFKIIDDFFATHGANTNSPQRNRSQSVPAVFKVEKKPLVEQQPQLLQSKEEEEEEEEKPSVPTVTAVSKLTQALQNMNANVTNEQQDTTTIPPLVDWNKQQLQEAENNNLKKWKGFQFRFSPLLESPLNALQSYHPPNLLDSNPLFSSQTNPQQQQQQPVIQYSGSLPNMPSTQSVPSIFMNDLNQFFQSKQKVQNMLQNDLDVANINSATASAATTAPLIPKPSFLQYHDHIVQVNPSGDSWMDEEDADDEESIDRDIAKLIEFNENQQKRRFSKDFNPNQVKSSLLQMIENAPALKSFHSTSKASQQQQQQQNSSVQDPMLESQKVSHLLHSLQHWQSRKQEMNYQ